MGVFLTDTLFDDCDITCQVRYLYAVGTSLRSTFHKCSIHIKNMLFRAHCCTLYASQLWCCVVTPMRAIDVFECLTIIPTVVFIRAGQVRKLVRKSANPQLWTNKKSCEHVDLRTLAV